MRKHPFKLLAPFADRLDVFLLEKEDAVESDEDIRRTVRADHFVGLCQKHGGHAIVVREPSSRLLEADAALTDTIGLTLSIRFADCQGFVLYDPKKNVVALVHAGWKGMCLKILTSAFSLLRSEWAVDPADVIVCAGPSLCTQCADFTDPHKEAPELKEFIVGLSIDLRAAADAELLSIGVLPDHRERISDCTRCSPETYFTYRGGDREKVQAGSVNCFAVTLRESSKK